MDYLYFILVILVFLKVLFWIFYFYARSQRLRSGRTTQSLRSGRTTQRNFFVVERTRQVVTGNGVTHDQAGIVQNEYPHAYTNQAGPQNFPAPPSYTECVGQPQTDTKPPSYEQVVQGQASTYPTPPATVPPTATAPPLGQPGAPSPNPLYGYDQ